WYIYPMAGKPLFYNKIIAKSKVLDFLKLLFLAAVASLTLTACNSYSDNALLGDAKPEELVAGSTADWKADESDVSIKILNTGNITAATADTKIELSGDCFPSLYKRNRIDVLRITNNTRAANPQAFSSLGADAIPHCVNGKFSITINTAGIPVGNHIIQLNLIGVDDDLSEHTNPSDGSSSINLRRM
ncbi:MAG: hypothetical protein ACOYOK_07265, partial [Pseudobdellovibrionaceae bacterium]